MISLTVNGVSFPYPQTGDSNWGTGAAGWAQAVTTGMLSLAGGSFPLTAQVDFGTNFGIKVLSLTTETAIPAGSGFVRLAGSDALAWRNNANSSDILLGKDSSDRLTWNGNPVVSSTGIIPLASGGTNANLTAAAGAIPYLTASAFALLAPGSSGQVLTSGGAGAPTWSSSLTNPMTTLGDIIIGGAVGAATRLAGDTSNTRKFLRELSSGGVATSPAWDTLLAADVPTLNQNTTGTASNVTGTVAIVNGGTGQTAKTAAFDALQPMTTGGDIIYGGASGSGTRLANGSSGQVLTSAGGTAAPSWAAHPTATYFQGYTSQSSSWSTATTGSYVDGTNAGGNALTSRVSSGITVTAAASNLAGITFTPASSTAVYLITASTSINSNTNTADLNLRLTDGTIVLVETPAFQGPATVTASLFVPVTMTGVYAPGTGSAVTVKIQIQGNAGTTTIQSLSVSGVIQWSIVRMI